MTMKAVFSEEITNPIEIEEQKEKKKQLFFIGNNRFQMYFFLIEIFVLRGINASN